MAAKAALHAFRYDGVRSGTERKMAPPQVGPNTYIFQRDRIQLLREAIDLENNFAPAKMLNRIYSMYTAPVAYNAQTGDAELDRDVEEYLYSWFDECDITGRHDFFQMMAYGIMGMNRGGDYGFWITRDGLCDLAEGQDASELPVRIMGVEADRIGGLYQTEIHDNYVGGITLDVGTGKPTQYRIYERSIGAEQYVNPVEVPACDFVHVMDTMQADMYRGVTKLDAACSQLRDLYEMVGYIKGKAKLASALTLFTNSIGSTIGRGPMDPYLNTEFVDAKGGQQQDIYLGQINHLPAGADMKFPDSDSPGPETQYLMKLLLQLTCMSYNLPYSFGIDASALGGVSARLESEQAKAEFERGQRLIDRHATKIKNVVIADAVAKGVFPAQRMMQACRGKFSHRPHPQPDIGKEASAAVSLYQTGLLNPIEHWTENGQDPEKVASDMVKWAKIKTAAVSGTEYKVEEIFGAGPAMPIATSVSTTEDATIDGRPSHKKLEEWRESDHPRADDGKFGPTSGRSQRASVGEMHPATREGTGKDSKIMVGGKPAPEHIKAGMIPPAYSHNIRISADKNSDVWAISEDEKGNTKRVYNPAFENRNAAIKWARTNEGVSKADSIRAQIHNDRNQGKSKEEADATWLMSVQATRPGSEEDTKGNKSLWAEPVTASNFTLTNQPKGPPKVSIKVGNSDIIIRDEGARAEIESRIKHGASMGDAGYWIKSHGATTLEGRHVVESPDGGARLQFMGKEGVWHDHKVSDPSLAKMLLARKQVAGDSGKLFDTDYQKVSKYVGTLGGGGFSPKDMRTIRANELATKMIGGIVNVKNDDERKQFIKDVAIKVSGVLGNRPQQALESYINPMLFDAVKVRKSAA